MSHTIAPTTVSQIKTKESEPNIYVLPDAITDVQEEPDNGDLLHPSLSDNIAAFITLMVILSPLFN